MVDQQVLWRVRLQRRLQRLACYGLTLLLSLQYLFLPVSMAYAAPLPTGEQLTVGEQLVVGKKPLAIEGRTTPEQCQSITEAELRPELTRSIQSFFAQSFFEGETAFEFETQVAREWKLLNLDGQINAAAARAVEQVQANTKVVDRFFSSWNPNKAEQLAEQVITMAFNDELLQRSLQNLATNIGSEISDQIELATVRSTSFGMHCLQTFISGSYSTTFADFFDQKTGISARLGSDDFMATFAPDSQQYLSSYGLAAGGIATIAVAQITRRVTQTMTKRVVAQVSERILGRVGTTVLPFIGEIVGGTLLISDVVRSFSGSFDEIQAQITSPEVKQTLRDSIAGAIAQDIGGQSPQIAREIATELYANWIDFQNDYRETLELARELPEFNRLVAKETDISRITTLVGIGLTSMGRERLIDAIQDGSFERALSLPTIAQEILKNTGSIEEAIAWCELAGNRIQEVVETELYKHLSRDGLDRALLLQILDLENRAVIAKLSLLNNRDIRQLLAIASPNFIPLAEAVSAQDLERLSGYIAKLEQYEANALIKFLLDGQAAMLKDPERMAQMIESEDILAAFRFWQQPKSIVSLVQGGGLVVAGAIAWPLVLSKYGELYVGEVAVSVVLLLLLALAIVLWFYRQVLNVRQKLLQLKASDD